MSRQNGFALAAAMMVLALLSVLGMAAIQSTTLEVKISAHDRDARAALYVAESALEEARYYVARGWGKIAVLLTPPVTFPLPPTVVVEIETTPFPAGLPWATDLYRGFDLIDAAGRPFQIITHDDAANPQITVNTSTAAQVSDLPTSGRFAIVREIAAATSAGNDLTVADDDWANASDADTWAGWVLLDQNDVALSVTGSTAEKIVPPLSVTLNLSAAPDMAAMPFTLAYNPWLGALASGSAPDGDAVPGTVTVWDREFRDPSSQLLGTAGVTAQQTAPGEYRLQSNAVVSGPVYNSQRRVSMSVLRAGGQNQRIGDWRVEDDDS